MNGDLRKKKDSEKDFFKLIKNTVFGKTMENVRKYRHIKLVTTEIRRNYLVFEPNYQTTIFHRTSIGNRNEKNAHTYEKTVYLGLSILELSKILMYHFGMIM